METVASWPCGYSVKSFHFCDCRSDDDDVVIVVLRDTVVDTAVCETTVLDADLNTMFPLTIHSVHHC
jgi:hypothetical protein